MEEINFSILNHGQAASEALQNLLERFEALHEIHVHLDVIPTWALGWSRLVENALYRSGPDISESGNTWIGDLARMEALHPFTQEQVTDITKHTPLFENVWKTRISDETGQALIYSIPWTGDTRAVFFRRDILEKANIEAQPALSDTAHFETTISNLKNNSACTPLAITTRRSSLTIHNIASWIWSAGGDFLSPDGGHPVFDQPQALEGCKAYFRLGRYLDSQVCNFDEDQSNLKFRSGGAAITMNGYWLLDEKEMDPDVFKNVGVVPMPGSPFVGGQDLVVWNHSRHISAAIKLIAFLHSEEAGRKLFPLYGLPVSESAWENPPFNSGYYPIFKTAIQQGRGFHGQLWGLVEKRLTDEYAEIWTEVLKSPDTQMDTIIETHLNNLAHRLQLSMGST